MIDLKDLQEFRAYDIISFMDRRGFDVYENSNKLYNLNIISFRSQDLTPGLYNDMMFVMYKTSHGWELTKFVISTDPGLVYLKNPLVSTGTAIMAEQQAKGAYKLCGPNWSHGCKGHGKRKYECLRQVKPMWFYRDNDKDDRYDFNESTKEYKVISANIHHGATGIKKYVGVYSAACQVHQDKARYYEVFLPLVRKAVGEWGNSFTYSLIDLNNEL